MGGGEGSEATDDGAQARDRAKKRKELLGHAKALAEYSTIQAAVNGQIDATKKKVSDLKKLCSEEEKEMIELNRKLDQEQEIADQEASRDPPEVMQELGCGDLIKQIIDLQTELDELYHERKTMSKRLMRASER
jgi:hypothetical protein